MNENEIIIMRKKLIDTIEKMNDSEISKVWNFVFTEIDEEVKKDVYDKTD